MQIAWDAKKIIDSFGGCRRLHTNLKRHGFNHPLKTIEQWHWRRSIPAKALAEIQFCATDDGLPLNITDHIISQDTDNGANNTEPKDEHNDPVS